MALQVSRGGQATRLRRAAGDPLRPRDGERPPALARGAPDDPLEVVQERRLTLQDLRPRGFEGEPRGPIDLRELLPAARPRRPLHGVGRARHGGGIEVAPHGPRIDELSPRLAPGRKREGLTRRPRAGLFLELAPRGGERIFPLLDPSLGNGPRARVLLLPERPARMHEEHFEPAGGVTKKQKPGALLHAPPVRSYGRGDGPASIFRWRNQENQPWYFSCSSRFIQSFPVMTRRQRGLAHRHSSS